MKLLERKAFKLPDEQARDRILRALHVAGSVTAAAANLGVSRTWLYSEMRRLGIIDRLPGNNDRPGTLAQEARRRFPKAPR